MVIKDARAWPTPPIQCDVLDCNMYAFALQRCNILRTARNTHAACIGVILFGCGLLRRRSAGTSALGAPPQGRGSEREDPGRVA